MCGIAGIVGERDAERALTLVRNMTERLKHRGPDAGGVFQHGEVTLGHRRLSILDTSSAANQPFVSADGRHILVFNGEIYNFRKLARELAGVNWHTQSDTEVLLEAWKQWGTNCLARLEGMFVFAAYDKESGNLLIARDRLGIKPLYLWRDRSVLCFASEMRSLLNAEIPRKLNRAALADYLRYQTIHAPATLVQGVEMLLPGHALEIDENGERTFNYWSPETAAQPAPKDLTVKQAQNEVRRLFFEAVEKRLIVDVPLGAFLSGGIDSSAVVCAMTEVSSQTVNTFHIDFSEEQFSEAKFARQIAKRFKTNHHELKLNPQDLLHALPEALQALDFPSGDGPNTWLVSRETKKGGITVALSGLGGDELFAGYPFFDQLRQLQQKRWLLSFPGWMRRWAASALLLKGNTIAARKTREVLAADYFDLEYIYPYARRVFLENDVEKLLTSKSLPPDAVKAMGAEVLGYGKSGFALPFLSRISVYEIHTYLSNVLLRDTDQMSMAHALEVRVPFLDHKLVEYVLGLPDAFKLGPSPKELLVQALHPLLPEEVIHRPKMGFTLPWDVWLRTDLREFAQEQLYQLAERKEFNRSAIVQLCDTYLAGKSNLNFSRVWPLIVLNYWLNKEGIE